MICKKCGNEVPDNEEKCSNCGAEISKKGKKGLIVKIVILVVVVLLSIPILAKLLHEHEWKEATCEECKICVTCGEQEGEALGHDWREATCEVASYCSRCAKMVGEPAGHVWKEATCETPSVCLECKEEGTAALGHDWSGSMCDSTDPCKRCGLEKTSTAHKWSDPKDCTEFKKCTECGFTSEYYGAHSTAHSVWKDACPLCGEVIQKVKLNSANWKNYFNMEVNRYGSWTTISITPKYKQCSLYNAKVKIKTVQRWESNFGMESKVKTLEFELKDYEVYQTLSGSDHISVADMTTSTVSASGEMNYFEDRLYVK